jgi:hypothetical protein
MKYVVAFLILLVTTGCPVYDPPLKGNKIFIHNQTADFVYVLDSLPVGGKLRLYDTFWVNGKRDIEKKPDYMPKYSTWSYFFSEPHFRQLKKKPADSLSFYFIPPDYIDSSFEQIHANRRYTTIKLHIDEAWNKTINHIFYYGDSIAVTHEYNVSYVAGKQASD